MEEEEEDGEEDEEEEDDAEEEDLDRRAGRVPERPGDAVVERDVGRLEEGGGPGPLTNDDGGSQTCLDHSSGSAAERRKKDQSA